MNWPCAQLASCIRHPACSRFTTLLLLVSFNSWLFGAATLGQHGVVATGHPLATEAALQAMKQGGNAVDTAVAAALTLGVVDGHNSGIGGGCLMLIRLASGSVIALDGRETAPATARRDLFIREGKAETRLSQTGALAPGVPGSLAVYDDALQRHGKLRLKHHLLAAAEIAETGFIISRTYAQRLSETAPDLKQFSASRAIFFRPNGLPLAAGDRLRQLDLARTYRAIAKEGIDWFYRGPFAQATGDWMRQNGGCLTAADFQNYQLKRREPLRTTYRGHEIIGFPPPSSGGVLVAEILNVLEVFDLKAWGPDSADFIHVTAEAMKRAFADRAHWLGDSDFVPVPRGLASKWYAATLARQIRLDRTTPVLGHGTPERTADDVFGQHTTHFSSADAEGNWVACTATLNTSFGCKVMIPGTGVVLNNQMDDFSVQPGVTNYFGLIGGNANAVAPGKRPLSSMSPTIVLKDGKPILALGAAGGPTIISQTVLAILYTIDFGMPLDQALAAPRFHQQWQPDELRIERKVGRPVLRELERSGHKLKVVNSLGVAQAVAQDSHTAALRGASDPRAEGRAMGY